MLDEKRKLDADVFWKNFMLKSGKESPIKRSDKVYFPPFYNEEMYRKAQQFFRKHYFSLLLSHLCGVYVSLIDPKLNTVFGSTGCFGNPAISRKTVKNALSFIHKMCELEDPRDYWKDLNENNAGLRRVYASVSALGLEKISQRDVSVGFGCLYMFLFLMPDDLGIDCQDENEWECVNHFWRNFGYYFGIADEFNMCRESVDETRHILRHLFNNITKNYNPDYQPYIKQTTSLVNGAIFFTDSIAFKLFLSKRLEENFVFALQDVTEPPTKISLLKFNFMEHILHWLKSDLLRNIINTIIRFVFQLWTTFF